MSTLKTKAEILEGISGYNAKDIEAHIHTSDINRLYKQGRNLFVGAILASCAVAFGVVAIQEKADLPYIPGEGIIAVYAGAAVGAKLSEDRIKPEIQERIDGIKLPEMD